MTAFIFKDTEALIAASSVLACYGLQHESSPCPSCEEHIRRNPALGLLHILKAEASNTVPFLSTLEIMCMWLIDATYTGSISMGCSGSCFLARPDVSTVPLLPLVTVETPAAAAVRLQQAELRWYVVCCCTLIYKPLNRNTVTPHAKGSGLCESIGINRMFCSSQTLSHHTEQH